MITKYHRKRSSLSRFGSCPICNRDAKLHADHCHTTGLTRSPICGPCNRGLGLFADSTQRLRAAATYLELWQQRHAAHHTQTHYRE